MSASSSRRSCRVVDPSFNLDHFDQEARNSLGSDDNDNFDVARGGIDPQTPTPSRESRNRSSESTEPTLELRKECSQLPRQLQAKLGIKNNAVPFNSSSPSRKPLVPTSSESSSSPSVERQLSVSPTLNRTRRVSSSSSAASSTSDPPPPPPNAPLPPVPTTTRIPVAVNATGGYAPVGPVALNRALLSNDANGATQPRRSSTSEPTTDESTTTTSKTVNVPTLVTPTGPDPSLADPTTGREPKNDAEEAIDRSLSPPPILLAARQSRLSDPTYNHHSQRYHQQYLASSSTSSSARPENPFFGSGTPARERLTKSASSAQSGSGKVISGLQSELLQAKNALESTRGQLRLSQRAVDFLGRQNGEFFFCFLFIARPPERGERRGGQGGGHDSSAKQGRRGKRGGGRDFPTN